MDQRYSGVEAVETKARLDQVALARYRNGTRGKQQARKRTKIKRIGNRPKKQTQRGEFKCPKRRGKHSESCACHQT
ncbi:hypothetical protein M5D96_003547, partial [Drosophila gunungcola]